MKGVVAVDDLFEINQWTTQEFVGLARQSKSTFLSSIELVGLTSDQTSFLSTQQGNYSMDPSMDVVEVPELYLD